MIYANRKGYTDIEPFVVISARPPAMKQIRRMKTTIDPTWEPEWMAGGFAGHCVNQNDQRWIIELDPDGEVVTIRLHKDGIWKDKHGNKYTISDTPVKFYDYNF